MGAARGLLVVYTGTGKGKTTAALGLLFRGWAQGWRMCVIQFIKHEAGRWSEVRTAQELGIEWIKSGDGFTWLSRDLDRTAERARSAWQLAREKIASGRYHLVLLDEFTYPLYYGWLSADAVVQWLRSNRPLHTHVIITGRHAPPALVELADLVTEMKEVKHPYSQGIAAQPGIDY
ncbi:MAG: cob(I)yrinic acid a,c-diamide adenosyltransferase [Bacillota bacterium]